MSLRNFSSTAIQTTLSGGITASGTSMTVAATTGFPAAPFILALEPGTANQEIVLVTAVAGTTLTVTRGYDSTTGVAHNNGAVVQHSHAAIEFREANTHVNASTGVHGVAGAVVGTSDAQTVTNKTISADDNTINGFAASSFIISDGTGKADGSAAQKVIPGGTVVGTSDVQTLTSKTIALGSNTVSGTKAQFNTACTDADFATLDGAETLTNKTLTTPVIGGATLTSIQKGNGTCVFSASAGPVSVAVTFPVAFSVAPEVVLGSQNNTTIFWATSITTTGFTLNARQFDGVARTVSPVCSYIAMV